MEWSLSGRQVAAVGSGAGLMVPPYVLRVEQVAADQPVPEQVEFTLHAALYDAQGGLLESNDHSEISFALVTGEGTWLDGDRKQVEGGEATAVLNMSVGTAGVVEVRLAGLEPARLVLGATALTSNIILQLERSDADPSLVEVDAELFDLFGEVNVEDSSAVIFDVVRGGGVLIGPAMVGPAGGRAHTRIRLVIPRTELVVSARQGRVRQVAMMMTSSTTELPPAPRGGLTVSREKVAGRDELPPDPPLDVRAVRRAEEVEVSWELSETDGKVDLYPFQAWVVHRDSLKRYRIFRSRDGGLYEEMGQVESGVDRFVDALPEEAGTYRYKVLAEDLYNLSEMPILPGSPEDKQRTLALRPGVPVDVEGEPVLGLFGEDLQVGFDDFFLFADHFGRQAEDADFEEAYDLDGSGLVDFADFFIFADNFGRVAVSFD